LIFAVEMREADAAVWEADAAVWRSALDNEIPERASAPVFSA
jgi:hypothetical protein